VCDEGPGVPADIVDRIFDPFFSTKGDKGNGLGLSVASGIIERHGGRIRLDSSLGQGATFCVELPVVLGEPSVAQLDSHIAVGAWRVLVIDDDELVRDGLDRALTRFGCTVTGVGSIQSAERELQSGSFDVLLCDERLGGVSGYEFLVSLREAGNRARMVLLSGTLPARGLGGSDVRGSIRFVEKPVGIHALREVVRQ
jgi:CheY-like chemotaxis protein